VTTVLQAIYREVRADGASHHAAVRQIARRAGLDQATVVRSLRRAEQDGVRAHASNNSKGLQP
jgi:DNA-binding MarR family transcriptional regulator